MTIPELPMESLQRSYNPCCPLNKIDEEPSTEIESSKCFVKLSQIDKFSMRSDVASTWADDTASIMSSLSSSPKQGSNKRTSCKNGSEPAFTLKDIATKRKYIKRIDPKPMCTADLPTKKVKKQEEAPQTKIEVQPIQEDQKIMVVWENGKAKIIDVQEQVQTSQNAGCSVKASKHTTSHSFKKLNHALQWADAETKKFYRVVLFLTLQ